MKKTILGLFVVALVFLIGCAPAAQQPAAQPPAAETVPADTPVEAGPAESAPAESEAAPAPLENTASPVKEGLDIEQACYGLLSAEDFVSICGYGGQVVLTPKISEGGCWLNIADHQNNKLTAGFTTVDWDKADKANSEFDRGVKARVRQGAVEGTAVGERSYEYDEIGRHNIVWVTDRFLTRLGAMSQLCSAEKLVEVGKKIDAGMRQ
jgi:hypothetical protein